MADFTEQLRRNNMKHIFLTYGDAGYEAAKNKIIQEASKTGEFDNLYAFGREDLSEELLASDVIKVKTRWWALEIDA